MDLVRRDRWGARPPKGRPKEMATPVRHLFLHHSAGEDRGAESVRSIQSFHQDVRGWADIGYTWLYSPAERKFYEGRGPGVRGAHTRGYNHVGHAVCVLGNYQVDMPPAHVVDDLAVWAEWHGATWGPGAYEPHRDYGQTACPGKFLLELLPDVNETAASIVLDEPHRSDDIGHWEWMVERGLL